MKKCSLFGIAALGFVLGFGKAQACDQEISQVTVRDLDKTTVIKVISAASDLALLNNAWCHLQPLSSDLKADWQYKLSLDIQNGAFAESWLYDPRGYIRLLTKQESPLYKLSDVAAFNRVVLN